MIKNQRVAILIPCYNEELTIEKVINDFKSALPNSEVYVFDNNSTDSSIALAKKAGAYVNSVFLQGKGNVVRRMFADIESDIYILVDADGTYDAHTSPEMIERLIQENLDMVVARRQSDDTMAYRNGHQLGNFILTKFVSHLFGRSFTDILSGYRVFSRRYVKSFPAIASGFEIETELTVHALELRMPVAEIDSQYISRPEGSISKLNTYRDGFRILSTIFNLYRLERPLQFFGLIGGVFIVISILLAIPIFETYFQTGLVPRLPTAILSTGLSITGFLAILCGLILDTVTHGRHELKQLTYLQIPATRKR